MTTQDFSTWRDVSLEIRYVAYVYGIPVEFLVREIVTLRLRGDLSGLEYHCVNAISLLARFGFPRYPLSN